MNTNDWVCIDADEDDYVIERFEVRVKGKKPLVLNHPSYSKLLFVTQQYLNVSNEVAKDVLRHSILATPNPICFDEYWRIRSALENTEFRSEE
ncbi:hypothetical protein MD535_25620 [Vibrio sp. ZSDZ65]|uniref:Uncharacterized protein n=1 Tax=Vibrio qingdaonensis TaxID=2829491 RepID=A0A9X3I006_9VIBR|nr:hypothetical protein [Vibrio qingdaonensis]MCW8349357.1 hypothetical protein [Vibrio qingdaonensis]